MTDGVAEPPTTEPPTAASAGGGPSPALARLWAGWRTSYLERVNDDDAEVRPDAAGRSLFERILDSGLPDEEAQVLWRGATCFAVLNAYPYGSGHLMVLPNRAAADLADLTEDEAAELWTGVRRAVAAIRAAYRPDGVNVGINLGAGAGAGVPDHLHVHCLPRWLGDTNFMTAVAEARVLPEPLAVSWRKLRAAWPAPA
ncbi:MAG TPA: HIT domain-containing protein [Aquihabitans sp.]|jgi:ATP adenylyltransferase|nr:HIT domain-containing protein [Aquihabitans sp.]